MSGPPKTPKVLNDLKGNPGKRKPVNTVEPTPDIPDTCPTAPSRLSATGKSIWNDNAKTIHTMGLLTKADLDMFEAYCDAYGKHIDINADIGRKLSESGGSYTKDVVTLVRLSNDILTIAIRIAGLFGMSPSARASKLDVRDMGTKKESSADKLKRLRSAVSQAARQANGR